MFKLHSNFKPTGDQPEAIKKLVGGINKGEKSQVLMALQDLVRHLQWLML